MKTVIHGATISPQAVQSVNALHKFVEEKSTLEFVSGRIKFIKDIKGPSLDRQ